MTPRDKGVSVAGARVVGPFPIGDGTFLETIHGFSRDARGLLHADFRAYPLIPDEWRGASQPDAFSDNILAVIPWQRYGVVPELLILTDDAASGVWRFAPWTRNSGGINPGLEVINYYDDDGSHAVASAGAAFLAPSWAIINNAVYFTFGDASGVYYWDGVTVSPLGVAIPAAAPQVQGPQPGTTSNNAGFSARGRIGTTNGDWTLDTTAGNDSRTVGGIENGEWRYAVVYEMRDGSYSPMSEASAPVRVQQEVADGTRPSYYLRRRFRVMLPEGPSECVARVVLRTPNIRALGALSPEMRFHSRVPHNLPHTEIVDDLPDGELGDIWQNRLPEPIGTRFIGSFDGGLWRFGSTGAPSRAWFSERTPSGAVAGSIGPGHWLDVFPATGPLTAAVDTALGAAQGTPTLLVFKPSAVHYIAGNYPAYQCGTLHMGSGCAGPGCVQTCPDGSVIWYSASSGTFWRWAPESPVQDIGAPLRALLKRVNATRASRGCSWTNAAAGETVFVLPMDDEDRQSYQFVWDYVAGGWRTRQHCDIRSAAVLPEGVLIGGRVNGVSGVFWYGLGRGNYANPSFSWELRTAWMPVADGPRMHADSGTAHVVVVGEDAGNGTPTLGLYLDWNSDTTLDASTIGSATPEQTVPLYGSAVYGTDVWRTPRLYRELKMEACDLNVVYQIRVSGSSPWSLLDLHVFTTGPNGSPGARALSMRAPLT